MLTELVISSSTPKANPIDEKAESSINSDKMMLIVLFFFLIFADINNSSPLFRINYKTIFYKTNRTYFYSITYIILSRTSIFIIYTHLSLELN